MRPDERMAACMYNVQCTMLLYTLFKGCQNGLRSLVANFIKILLFLAIFACAPSSLTSPPPTATATVTATARRVTRRLQNHTAGMMGDPTLVLDQLDELVETVFVSIDEELVVKGKIKYEQAIQEFRDHPIIESYLTRDV